IIDPAEAERIVGPRYEGIIWQVEERRLFDLDLPSELAYLLRYGEPQYRVAECISGARVPEKPVPPLASPIDLSTERERSRLQRLWLFFNAVGKRFEQLCRARQ